MREKKFTRSIVAGILNQFNSLYRGNGEEASLTEQLALNTEFDHH